VFSVIPVVKGLKVGHDSAAATNSATTWTEAQTWIAGLGSGWRTPTIAELQAIYDADSTRDSAKLDPAFETTGYKVWSVELDSTNAHYFHFTVGTGFVKAKDFSDSSYRAFAVSAGGTTGYTKISPIREI